MYSWSHVTFMIHVKTILRTIYHIKANRCILYDNFLSKELKAFNRIYNYSYQGLSNNLKPKTDDIQ